MYLLESFLFRPEPGHTTQPRGIYSGFHFYGPNTIYKKNKAISAEQYSLYSLVKTDNQIERASRTDVSV